VPARPAPCHQTVAWKAGHKRECAQGQGTAAATQIRRAALEAARPAPQKGLTKELRSLVTRLNELRAAADWRGIAALTEALGLARDVRGVDPGLSCGIHSILGNAYQSLGDFSQAIKCHTQRLEIAKEVGDRAGEGRAYGGLGNAHGSLGDFSQAIKCHTQRLEIAKEVGDRAGEGSAYGNVGTCHMHLNEYVKAVAYFEAQHVMAISLKLAHDQSDAALNMGVALTLDVRAGRPGPSTGADEAPGAPSHSSASACLDDRVREGAKWLQAALDGGHRFAKLHLAHLTFYAGQEDAALAHLKEHLSWRVQRGRDTYAGCGQTRGKDTPMLTCSGCRVARFCSADHTKRCLEKSRIGRESGDGAAQGYLRRAQQVARGCQRRCGA